MRRGLCVVVYASWSMCCGLQQSMRRGLQQSMRCGLQQSMRRGLQPSMRRGLQLSMRRGLCVVVYNRLCVVVYNSLCVVVYNSLCVVVYNSLCVVVYNRLCVVVYNCLCVVVYASWSMCRGLCVVVYKQRVGRRPDGQPFLHVHDELGSATRLHRVEHHGNEREAGRRHGNVERPVERHLVAVLTKHVVVVEAEQNERNQLHRH